MYVLDLNPRFGGGYPFSHAAGANLPAALLAWASNAAPDPTWLEARPDVRVGKCDRLVVVPSAGSVGIPMKPPARGRRRLPEEVQARIEEFYRAGHSASAISKELGVSYDSARSRVKAIKGG